MFWSNIYNYIKLVTLYYTLLQSFDFIVTFEKTSLIFKFSENWEISWYFFDINRVTVELIFFFLAKTLKRNIDRCDRIRQAKVTYLSLQSIFLYPATRHRRLSNICVIFEMARFSTPLDSFFLSSSVTSKSFGDKKRNVVYKG